MTPTRWDEGPPKDDEGASKDFAGALPRVDADADTPLRAPFPAGCGPVPRGGNGPRACRQPSGLTLSARTWRVSLA